MFNPFDVSNNTFLVTGASSGIGQQIAISLSNSNANVIFTGRSLEKLLETKKLMKEGKHILISADLTDEEDLKKLVEEVPKLDGIVHCAGVLDIAPFKVMSRSKFFKTFQINYEALYFSTQLLVKKKKLNRRASIVFMSSINGNQIGVQGFTSYAGTKAAIVGFAKSLAVELAPRYRVNCVLPGMIKTPMYLEMEKTISKEKVEEDKLLYPMKDYGDTEDIANAVIYLLSDASKWVTGTSLVIDGGFTVR